MFQDLNNNFRICIKCNALLIDEEFEFHSCFKIKNIFIDKKRIWVNDGEDKKWYRWYGFSPNFKHPNGTPREKTEPKFLNSSSYIPKILSGVPILEIKDSSCQVNC